MSIDVKLEDMKDPLAIKGILNRAYRLYDLGLVQGSLSEGNRNKYISSDGDEFHLMGVLLGGDQYVDIFNYACYNLLSIGRDKIKAYFEDREKCSQNADFWWGANQSLPTEKNNFYLRDQQSLGKKRPESLNGQFKEFVFPYLLEECNQYYNKLVDYADKWKMYESMFEEIEEGNAEIHKRKNVLKEKYGVLKKKK